MAQVFERPLDVASTPILRSHVIDGRPVLPMALILEWLAQGAMSRNPGMACCGVDDLRLLKGVVLREARPETIRVLAGKAARRDGHSVVPVELRGVLADGREVLHARGEVVLGDRHPEAPRPLEEPAPAPLRDHPPRDLPRRPVPRPRPPGDRRGRGVRRRRDRRDGLGRARPLGLGRPAAPPAVADRPPGPRLRLPDDDPLERRAGRGRVAADLRRAATASSAGRSRPAGSGWSPGSPRPGRTRPGPTSTSSTRPASRSPGSRITNA